jgi:Do/DeqQ family serine protease
MKKFIKYLIPSILGSAITLSVVLLAGWNKPSGVIVHSSDTLVPSHNAVYTVKEDGELVPLDFTGVSKEVMNSVVHVTSVRTMEVNNRFYRGENPLEDLFGDDFFRFFYGDPRQQKQQQKQMPREFRQEGTGSGVIISPSGYIVTNNHVVDGADEIEVTLHNNEVFKAKVIGTDPSTDLALLQIKADKLPALPIGNSNNVEVGEWVLAIGNPFNLDATVTAGIVSAKGRNINIINDRSAIEAFIQTDAAINPGNSGGALVNLKGELIGINTAIASPTGAYAGYGFAIPTSIVQKVVEDMMKYGTVQRAYLGVMIRDIDGAFAKENGLKTAEGAYIDSVTEKSAASKAGIEKGDVIVSIDGTPIMKSADVLEQVGIHRPGDKVSVTVNRKGKEIDYTVQLANREGTAKVISREDATIFQQLGATFETLDKKEAEKLGIEGGVMVKEIHSGILMNETDLDEGFIITGVNHQEVTDVNDFEKIMNRAKGGVLLEGLYEDYPGKIYVAFGLPE